MTTETPTFDGGLTVLIAVYIKCDAVLFERALASVYANTLLPDQVLVVADGPLSDPVNAVLDRYSREHGTGVLRLAVNGGLANALNAGIEIVKTAWIARADQDDINLPRRFELQAKAVARAGRVDIVGGNILEVDNEGRPVARRCVPEHHDDIVRYARRRNPFNHMTVVFRRDSVLKAGGYPDIMMQDYGLWAAMLGQGCMAANTRETLVHATAGRDMVRRRAGLKNARSEIALQRLLVDHGLKSSVAGIADGVARALVCLLPNWSRAFIYERLLRRPVGEGD